MCGTSVSCLESTADGRTGRTKTKWNNCNNGTGMDLICAGFYENYIKIALINEKIVIYSVSR